MQTAISPYRDTDSEQQILCSFLLEPELLYQVNIRTTDFSNKEFAILYEAMLKLYSDGILFDMKSLQDTATGVNSLTILDIIKSAITSANIAYHVKRVKQASFNRQARAMLIKLETDIDSDDFLQEADREIMKLYDFKNESKYYSISEILAKVRAQIEEAKRIGQFGVPTGFIKLDRSIVGLCPRHMVVLGAYTSYGKSTFLSEMTKNICKAGYSELIFSVEDSKEDKLIRLLATVSGRPIYEIVTGRVEPSVISWAEKEIESYDLAIYDDVYTLAEMDLKIRKHKMLSGIDVVAIDFVQNIQTKGENIYDRMSEVARVLQQLAKKHNVCIFALSQVSADEKGAIKLRGAQELSSAADIVLWIERDATNEKRDMQLLIRKNRPFGKTGRLPMTFNQTWTNIQEVVEDREEE